MADDTQATTRGEDPTTDATSAGRQGPATVPQAGDAGADARGGPDDGRHTPSGEQSNAQDGMTEAQLRAALKKANAEAAAYRKKANEYDERLRQDELAKLSEDELLRKQYAESQRENELLRLERQDIAVQSRVELTAYKLGIDPELALKIIDTEAIAFDDKGFPTNIHELIEQAMTRYSLAPSSAASAPPTGQPGVVARMAPPQVPATGATNPSRGATQQQPLVRSVHDIKWRRG